MANRPRASGGRSPRAAADLISGGTAVVRPAPAGRTTRAALSLHAMCGLPRGGDFAWPVSTSAASARPPRRRCGPPGSGWRPRRGRLYYRRDARSELFLLAVANLVGTDTFYEKGGDRDDRFTTLVRQLAVEDPEWTAGLLGWLRGEGNLRTAAIVGAAEFVHARLAADEPPHGRRPGRQPGGRRLGAAPGRRAGRAAGVLDVALRAGCAQAGQARCRRRGPRALHGEGTAQVRLRRVGLPLRRRPGTGARGAEGALAGRAVPARHRPCGTAGTARSPSSSACSGSGPRCWRNRSSGGGSWCAQAPPGGTGSRPPG